MRRLLRSPFFWLTVFALGILIVIGVLSLMGPAIGNIFSNVVNNLGGDGGNSRQTQVVIDNATEGPTQTPQQTLTPTHEAAATEEPPGETPTREAAATATIVLDDVTARPTQTAQRTATQRVLDATERAALAMTETAVARGIGFTSTPTQGPPGISQVGQTATALAQIFLTPQATTTATDQGVGGSLTTPIVTPLPNTGGGPSATPTLDIPVTEIAYNAPIQFVSKSGALVGTGVFRVYTQSAEITYPQTVVVELRLTLNSAVLTAVPEPSLSAMPPTFTPLPDLTPSDTPRPATATSTAVRDSGQQTIYQIMGASLLCSDRSFSDCDPTVEDGQQQPVSPYRDTVWTWTLSPAEGISGPQDLTIVAWRLIADSSAPDKTLVERVWTSESFSILVRPAGSTALDANTLLPIAMIAGIALIVLGGGVVLMLRRSSSEQTARRPFKGKRPTVFISYRRKPSFATARIVAERLESLGADVFIDVEDINEGRFADIIESAIQQREYFIPILAPTSLDSEWVQREISTAIKHNRRIIPLMMDGFSFESGSLPEELRDLETYNGVLIVPQYFDAAIEKWSRYLILMQK